MEIVGRDQELGSLEAFLDRTDEGFRAFVLEGEAGIGKSTLWRAGVEAARDRGLRVLESRPAEAERSFAHAGLGDLLEPVLDDVLPELAAPRRRALEVALALEEEPDVPVDPRTLAIAVRNALEVLAPVVVAVDDVQWLDASTAGALAFALRRLREENVLVLFARRLGEPTEAPDLDKVDAERLRVGPLSLGATQRLVQAELGTTLARPTLLRLHEASGGNPFYALELARALAAQDAAGDPTRPLPVPETLDGLVRARLEGLPDETRDALVLVAALGRASPQLLLAAGMREGALDAARDARVVDVDGTVRFTHPLLASALYQDLSAGERREAHRRLAEVVDDPIGRARHLALGTERADEEIAAALDDAAEQAAARGAMLAAAELAEHALRLTTPTARDARERRAIAAAHAHLAAGAVDRAKALADELEHETAEALLLRSDLVLNSNLHETIALRRRALEAASGRPELQAMIHRRLGLLLRFSEGIEAAEAESRAAVELAEQLDDDALRASALASLALVRFNGGKEDSLELAERAHELAVAAGDRGSLIESSFCLTHVLAWSSQLECARTLLEALDREWGARDERVAAEVSWYLSIVELRAGRWSLAELHGKRAQELHALYGRDDSEDPATFLPVALAAAHRGELERARELATYGWRVAVRQRAMLPGLEAAVGLVELWSGNAGEAVERLASAERTATKAGWVDPGIRWWRAASVERIATQAAIDTLQGGGNAVDAAVAAAAVLGVTEPFSAGIGGGGFMVVYQASTGKVTTIDHRETAPAAMTPTSFWENGVPLPFNDARYSGLSVGVPGTVQGWADALEKYGTRSLTQVLAPAIHTAEHGFVIDQTFFDQTNSNRDFFDDIPATAALYLDPDGTPRDVGTVFTNPNLAKTYKRIAHLGPKGFYRGAVADALVETVQHPPVAPTANHTWRPGVIKMRDLHTYVAPERAPTHVTYRGHDVYSMGPPSSGGSTVGEALNILEGYGLASMPREEALHYYLEASRYSFADRNAYLADPAYFDVPLEQLLSKEYAAERRALIKPTAASPPVVAPGNPTETTTHLTTSDKWGNVVSYTYTIESTGGSGLVVPGWGFLLNNELTDFNFDSTTHPNRVEGGKRPRSSMSPTIVLKGGRPFLALGSPGGSMIITTVLQLLVDRLDFGLTLPQAIADPRASQRNTAATSAEPAFLAGPYVAALRARGHAFSTTTEIGAATGIEFLPGGGVLAAAEPVRRGGGSAMVESP